MIEGEEQGINLSHHLGEDDVEETPNAQPETEPSTEPNTEDDPSVVRLRVNAGEKIGKALEGQLSKYIGDDLAHELMGVEDWEKELAEDVQLFGGGDGLGVPVWLAKYGLITWFLLSRGMTLYQIVQLFRAAAAEAAQQDNVVSEGTGVAVDG